MPTEMEARIRRRGAGSLVGRNRDRSRLDWNDWCRGRYSSGNGYDRRAVKEGVKQCSLLHHAHLMHTVQEWR
jgi:hypothetical protein